MAWVRLNHVHLFKILQEEDVLILWTRIANPDWFRSKILGIRVIVWWRYWLFDDGTDCGKSPSRTSRYRDQDFWRRNARWSWFNFHCCNLREIRARSDGRGQTRVRKWSATCFGTVHQARLEVKFRARRLTRLAEMHLQGQMQDVGCRAEVGLAVDVGRDLQGVTYDLLPPSVQFTKC